uniref:Protein-tyrosine-phosphatase n=1 Tax=Steinernema glaseri TaxID=37863 RepID=A0A1I8AVL0_9BILA
MTNYIVRRQYRYGCTSEIPAGKQVVQCEEVLYSVCCATMKKAKRPNKQEIPGNKISEISRQKAKPKKGDDKPKSKEEISRVRTRAAGNARNAKAKRRTLDDDLPTTPENETVIRGSRESDRVKDKHKEKKVKKGEAEAKKEKEKDPVRSPASTATDTADVDGHPRSQFLMVGAKPAVVESEAHGRAHIFKKEQSDRRAKKTCRKRRTYIEEDRRVEDEHEVKAEPKDETPVEMTDADTTQTATQKEKTDGSDNRSRWALTIARRKLKPLVKEFAENRKYLPKDLSTDTFQRFSAKNRYADVFCTDHTRVILKNREEDYIHANWLTVPNSAQKYICTQGPLEETLEDFWYMILQERVPVIVMLCAVVEGGSEKCTQYWPLAAGETMRYGNISIRNEKVTSTGIDTVRCTMLEVESRDDKLTVAHYQWADWPDHLAPTDPKPAVELLRLCKTTSSANRPIVVHCSAGIGRTGTFCGIDFASERIKANSQVSMVSIMKEIRQQRVHSIQTTLQYLYLHTCVLEYFIKNGYMKADSSIKSFTKEYERYLNRFRSKASSKDKDKEASR